MRYYKVLNLKRQQQGPYVLPEAGYKVTMESKSLAVNIQLLGECDAGGNILHDIASSNFISKKPVVIDAPTKKADPDPDFDAPVDDMFKDTTDPEQLSESLSPELQTFEEPTPIIDEQKTTTTSGNTGTGKSGAGKKSTKAGTGKKAGARK